MMRSDESPGPDSPDNQEAGATNLLRLQRHSQAILVSLIVKGLVIVLILVECIFNLPTYFVVMAVLFILPWVGIACIRYFKGSLTLYRGPQDTSPSAGLLFWAPAFALLANSWFGFDLYYFTRQGALALIGLSVLFTAMWLYLCRGVILREDKKEGLAFGIFLAACSYSYALLIFSNCCGDASTREIRRVEVEDKFIKHTTKSGDAYRISMSPWDDNNAEKTVGVSESYYEKIKQGDSLTVYISNGRWSIPWYRIDYEHFTRN